MAIFRYLPRKTKSDGLELFICSFVLPRSSLERFVFSIISKDTGGVEEELCCSSSSLTHREPVEGLLSMERRLVSVWCVLMTQKKEKWSFFVLIPQVLMTPGVY